MKWEIVKVFWDAPSGKAVERVVEVVEGTYNEAADRAFTLDERDPGLSFHAVREVT